MDIKKSSLLEDRFELSSFSLKIYNVNMPEAWQEFHAFYHSLTIIPDARTLGTFENQDSRDGKTRNDLTKK